jgi:hypothetical protein
MVSKPIDLRTARERGGLMIELLVAIALLTGALLPLAYSVGSEKRLARATYQRAVAMEIVDGEMEVLLAGEWRNFVVGTQDYVVHARSATNLPPGKFRLTVGAERVRLEWRPAVRDHGGSVIREAVVK